VSESTTYWSAFIGVKTCAAPGLQCAQLSSPQIPWPPPPPVPLVLPLVVEVPVVDVLVVDVLVVDALVVDVLPVPPPAPPAPRGSGGSVPRMALQPSAPPSSGEITRAARVTFARKNKVTRA
jgi:hypothetical protein